MTILILENGLTFPVDTVSEIDVYESFGNGFRARIWRTDGYENLFTEWTTKDQQHAIKLGIKTTMKTI